MTERADLALSQADERKEFGASGTIWLNGILVDSEYNRDLTGEKGLQVYDRMYRSDGQVRAVISVCELPILQAVWTVNPASDDPRDVEIAQFVHDDLFGTEGGAQPMGLRHALTMYRYGHSVAEKVWGMGDDGRVHLTKLAPRLARTIWRWYPTPEGELAWIQQRVWVPGTASPNVGPWGISTQGGGYEFRNLPAAKIVRFTLDQEGSDFTGISLLRAGYKHWYFKDQFYKIDAIAAERNAMAVPVFREPAGAQKSDRDRAAATLASLHAHEKAYILEPPGWEFRLEASNGRVRDIMPSIDHHNHMIAGSVLASFMDLGGGPASGSWALSKDQSTFFLQALKAVASQICAVYNHEVVRPLVDFNFEVDRYPLLTVADLDQRDSAAWMAAIAGLFTAGALTANPETENVIRREAQLPDLPSAATEPGGGQPTVDTGSQGAESEEKAAEVLAVPLATGVPGIIAGYWRELRPREQRTDLAAIDAGIDQAKRDFLAAVAPVQRQQIEALIAVAQKFVDRGQHVDVDKIDVPHRAELTTAMLEAMADQYRRGQRQVQTEAQKQRESAPITLAANDDFDAEDLPPRIFKFFQDKAKSTSGILVIQGKAEFARLMNRQTDDGTFDGDALFEQLGKAFERYARGVAPSLIHDALASGRSDGAQKLGAEVAEYSCILDQHSCGPCSALDGREFNVGSAEYDQVMPPYSGCEGGDQCRCIFIWDFVQHP